MFETVRRISKGIKMFGATQRELEKLKRRNTFGELEILRDARRISRCTPREVETCNVR